MSRVMFFIGMSTLAWGAVPLIDKFAIKSGLDPLVAILIRGTAMTTTVLAILLVSGRLPLVAEVPGKTTLLLALAGITSGIIGMWFYLSAMQLMNPGIVVAMTSTYPALTLILSFLIFGERLNLRQWGAVGLIIAGVVLLELNTTPPPPAPADVKTQ